jgi:hypothetical protein
MLLGLSTLRSRPWFWPIHCHSIVKNHGQGMACMRSPQSLFWKMRRGSVFYGNCPGCGGGGLESSIRLWAGELSRANSFPPAGCMLIIGKNSFMINASLNLLPCLPISMTTRSGMNHINRRRVTSISYVFI